MRITGVRVDIVDLGRANAIYVRIDTDRGLTGTGETILKRRDRSVEANLREIGEYLVGKDALAIEDHFEKLYRDTFWLGGPLHAAGRSAVDIALWDLKGQFYNAPIYQMLGGPTRDQILTYAHVATRILARRVRREPAPARRARIPRGQDRPAAVLRRAAAPSRSGGPGTSGRPGRSDRRSRRRSTCRRTSSPTWRAGSPRRARRSAGNSS